MKQKNPVLTSALLALCWLVVSGATVLARAPSGQMLPALVLDIAVSDSNVLLSWVPQPDEYDSYQMLRSADPYFQPGDPSVVVSTAVGSDTWLHGGAAGNVANNDCYVVRGITSLGEESPISNKTCAFTFDIENGVTGAYGDWNLSRTVPFENPQAAHVNPVDGKIYVGRRGTSSNGLYRIEADDSATLLAGGGNVGAVAIDQQTGHIFVSEDGVGTIFRTEFGQTGRTAWVSGFHSGDDDPVGMAFAPPAYNGPNIAAGAGVVVDRGYNGADEVWRFSPVGAEGETAVHADDGTLVDSVDIAVGINDIYLIDDKDAGDGVLYRLDTAGTLVEIPITMPILPAPEAIVVDPLTGNLFIQDIVNQKVYEMNPVNGVVVELLPGFVFSFPGGSSWAGLDISPDGQLLVVSDKGADQIYVFERATN